MQMSSSTRILALCAILFTSSLVQAEIGFGQETFNLRLGGFLSDFDTAVKLSGPGGGTQVDLEDTRGLEDDQAVFRGEATWRFAPRHRVSFGYYGFERDAINSSSDGFTVDTPDGSFEFDANVSIRSEFDWTLVPVTYSYSFYKTEAWELAGSLGVHWFDTRIGFSGSATVTPPGGVPAPVASASEVESASGPLPVIGIQAEYAISSRWRFGARLQYFGLDYDDYSGDLTDIQLRTEYWFNDNFGAGIGYTWYDIDFAKENGPYELGVEYSYDGLEGYVAFRF
jgi:hypothetical protein